MERTPPSPLHHALRTASASLHRRFEQRLGRLGLGGPTLSLSAYRAILRMFYGYYAPVEAGMVQLVLRGVATGMVLEPRAALLAHDLSALGADAAAIAALPRCAELPQLVALEDLAGCLYVLEGASLGGQLIAREVQARLKLTPDTGASFFTGRGAATAERWRSTLRWLDGVAASGCRAERIVTSARDVFRTFDRWVECQGSAT
jgi:heme oxygenase